MTEEEFKYIAFISYKHEDLDRKWSKWILEHVEKYIVPKELISKGHNKSLGKCYRDEDEASVGVELGEAINVALEQSKYLIVICSKQTPNSQWVTKEIEQFIKHRPKENVLLVLVDGDADEAFPKIIFEKFSDPFAAPGREIPEEPFNRTRERAIVKLIAGMMEVEFDYLWDRESRRKTRNLIFRIGLGVAAMVLAGFIFLNGQLKLREQSNDMTILALNEKSKLLQNISKRAIADHDYNTAINLLLEGGNHDPKFLDDRSIEVQNLMALKGLTPSFEIQFLFEKDYKDGTYTYHKTVSDNNRYAAFIGPENIMVVDLFDPTLSVKTVKFADSYRLKTNSGEWVSFKYISRHGIRKSSISNDGKFLVLGYDTELGVEFFNISEKRSIHFACDLCDESGMQKLFQDISINSTNTHVLTSYNSNVVTYIWDLKTRKLKTNETWNENVPSYPPLDISKDGRYLAYGARVFDTDNMEWIELKGIGGNSTKAYFLENGLYYVLASDLYVFKVGTWEYLEWQELEDGIPLGLSWSHDLKTILVWSADGNYDNLGETASGSTTKLKPGIKSIVISPDQTTFLAVRDNSPSSLHYLETGDIIQYFPSTVEFLGHNSSGLDLDTDDILIKMPSKLIRKKVFSLGEEFYADFAYSASDQHIVFVSNDSVTTIKLNNQEVITDPFKEQLLEQIDSECVDYDDASEGIFVSDADKIFFDTGDGCIVEYDLDSRNYKLSQTKSILKLIDEGVRVENIFANSDDDYLLYGELLSDEFEPEDYLLSKDGSYIIGHSSGEGLTVYDRKSRSPNYTILFENNDVFKDAASEETKVFFDDGIILLAFEKEQAFNVVSLEVGNKDTGRSSSLSLNEPLQLSKFTNPGLNRLQYATFLKFYSNYSVMKTDEIMLTINFNGDQHLNDLFNTSSLAMVKNRMNRPSWANVAWADRRRSPINAPPWVVHDRLDLWDLNNKALVGTYYVPSDWPNKYIFDRDQQKLYFYSENLLDETYLYEQEIEPTYQEGQNSYHHLIIRGHELTNKCLNKEERVFFDLDPNNPPCYCRYVDWPSEDYWIVTDKDVSPSNPFLDEREGGWSCK